MRGFKEGRVPLEDVKRIIRADAITRCCGRPTLSVSRCQRKDEKEARSLNLARKCMIFAPHPDDEILGCFGAIMSHPNREEDVIVTYLTSGERGDSSISPTQLRKTREQEAKKVMSTLGIMRYKFLGLPDGGLVPDPATVRMVTDVVSKHDPACVYAPNGKEPHKDHRAAFKVITEALQSLVSDNKCFEIRYYEVWGSLDKFNLVINISSLAETKKKIIGMYESQLKNIRYDEEILALNKRRGTMTQVGEYCETYDCYRIYSKETKRMPPHRVSALYPINT
jgi:LmbE family N-acetylglucosaminyl deacetylase